VVRGGADSPGLQAGLQAGLHCRLVQSR